jgi:hypothetical protein
MEPGSLADHQTEIPRTIRDTIELIEQLDIPYLWVDALCVIQDDAESKHIQISNGGHIRQCLCYDHHSEWLEC